jgi:hypothetical protein
MTILHIHRRNGRVLTFDSAKASLRVKVKDCPGCGGTCKGAVHDQTPGVERLRQSLADWQEEQRITQAEIAAAIPSARPALERILQNQTIRIKQLEMELFRLARDEENRGV